MEHPDKPVPRRGYVLTKSHCAGYCVHCAPRRYVVPTVEAFIRGCVRAERPEGETHYEPSVPARVVHLVRDPFDNIVARMHLEAKKRAGRTENGGDDELSVILDGSREAFNAFCLYLDEQFRTEERTTSLFDPDVKSFFWDLPCHSEWFRYVQWHNRAIELTEKLGIPVHFLFYEDYTTAFNKTATELLGFLDLSAVHDPFPFSPGHTYKSFYNAEQALQAAAFVQAIASPATWDLLQRYFRTNE